MRRLQFSNVIVKECRRINCGTYASDIYENC